MTSSRPHFDSRKSVIIRAEKIQHSSYIKQRDMVDWQNRLLPTAQSKTDAGWMCKDYRSSFSGIMSR